MHALRNALSRYVLPPISATYLSSPHTYSQQKSPPEPPKYVRWERSCYSLKAFTKAAEEATKHSHPGGAFKGLLSHLTKGSPGVDLTNVFPQLPHHGIPVHHESNPSFVKAKQRLNNNLPPSVPCPPPFPSTQSQTRDNLNEMFPASLNQGSETSIHIRLNPNNTIENIPNSSPARRNHKTIGYPAAALTCNNITSSFSEIVKQLDDTRVFVIICAGENRYQLAELLHVKSSRHPWGKDGLSSTVIKQFPCTELTKIFDTFEDDAIYKVTGTDDFSQYILGKDLNKAYIAKRLNNDSTPYLGLMFNPSHKMPGNKFIKGLKSIEKADVHSDMLIDPSYRYEGKKAYYQPNGHWTVDTKVNEDQHSQTLSIFLCKKPTKPLSIQSPENDMLPIIIFPEEFNEIPTSQKKGDHDIAGYVYTTTIPTSKKLNISNPNPTENDPNKTNPQKNSNLVDYVVKTKWI